MSTKVCSGLFKLCLDLDVLVKMVLSHSFLRETNQTAESKDHFESSTELTFASVTSLAY